MRESLADDISEVRESSRESAIESTVDSKSNDTDVDILDRPQQRDRFELSNYEDVDESPYSGSSMQRSGDHSSRSQWSPKDLKEVDILEHQQLSTQRLLRYGRSSDENRERMLTDLCRAEMGSRTSYSLGRTARSRVKEEFDSFRVSSRTRSNSNAVCDVVAIAGSARFYARVESSRLNDGTRAELGCFAVEDFGNRTPEVSPRDKFSGGIGCNAPTNDKHSSRLVPSASTTIRSTPMSHGKKIAAAGAKATTKEISALTLDELVSRTPKSARSFRRIGGPINTVLDSHEIVSDVVDAVNLWETDHRQAERKLGRAAYRTTALSITLGLGWALSGVSFGASLLVAGGVAALLGVGEEAVFGSD